MQTLPIYFSQSDRSTHNSGPPTELVCCVCPQFCTTFPWNQDRLARHDDVTDVAAKNTGKNG